MRSALRLTACASVAVLASTCGATSLRGSVGELFSLEVSEVEVLRNAEAFQVTYFNNRGTELDVVVRIGVALSGVELRPNVKLPLDGEYAPGHPRTSVAHAPGGEPQRLLPRVKSGDLTLTAGGEPEQLTAGSFSMSFEDSGGDLGAGRTLAGTFSAVAKDAGF